MDPTLDPPILRSNDRVEDNVVACAVAIHFAQNTVSDRSLKSRYGVASSTDVRGRWVNGKLAELLKLDADALAGLDALFWPSAPPPTAADAPAPAVEAEPAEEEAAAGEEVAGGEANEADEEAVPRPLNEEDGGEQQHLRDEIALIDYAAADYRRLSHLKHWSRAQRERWFRCPNPNMSSGWLCPEPSFWPRSIAISLLRTSCLAQRA